MNSILIPYFTGGEGLTPGWAAVVILLKATLLLLVALGVTMALRRASAGSRHLIWLTVLGTLLVLPPLAWWGPVHLPLLPGSPAPALEPTPTLDLSAGAAELQTPVVETLGTGETTGSPAAPIGTGMIVLGLWSLVAIALLTRLAHGAWMVHRVVRRSRALDDPAWQTPLYEIADRLGLEAAPRLLQSSEVKMPFAAGLFDATIVLPAESEAWSADRRSAVLVHELGHVRRRDLIGHTLSRVACAIYWFHPLVWTAARHLRAESERACDDLALTFGARPSDYAEHLLDIVTCVRDHNTPAVALAMAHRGEFEGRMLAILNPDLTRRGPTRRETATTMAALASLALLVGAARPVPRSETHSTADAYQAATTQATLAADTARRESMVAAPRQPQETVAPAPQPEPRATARPETANAMEVLQDSGADRVSALARALRSDSSARVRQVAAWGLQRYARTQVGAEALAAAVVNDSDPEVREMAAWALASARGNEAAASALARAMRDKNAEVRSTAVWAAGSMRSPATTAILAELLEDPSSDVREVAAWALGNSGIRKAPAALTKLLSDGDRDVRMSAAWAMYEIRDPETAPAIEAAFRRESDGDVRMGLIRALGTMGETAVPTLERLVSSPDARVREVAITALAGGNAGGPWPWPRPRPRPSP